MPVSTITLDAILPSGSPRFSELLNQGLKSGSFVLDRLANFRQASQFKWTKERPFLERLAALFFWVQLFTGIWGYMLAFYLSWRFTWRFLIFFVPYMAYMFGPGLRPSWDGSWPTPLKRMAVWRLLQRYFQAKLHKTADLDSSNTYLFGFHPHGIMPVSAWFTFGTTATGFDRLFPGVDVRVVTLPMNFRGPILREYLLLHGVCDVSRRSVLNLLGRGKSVAIAIGGAAESLHTAPGTHDLVLNRRKGFVKVALQSGASLVPVFCFGETDTYSTLNRLPFNSRVRRFQRAMQKLLGWTWPIAWGTGLFLPWGVLPYPARLNTVVGAPIHLPKYEGDVDSAEFRALVDTYHRQYMEAVRQLFKQHQELYAKGEDDLRIVE